MPSNPPLHCRIADAAIRETGLCSCCTGRSIVQQMVCVKAPAADGQDGKMVHVAITPSLG